MDELDKNDFRNNLATAGQDGKRIWVYPRKPKGFFHSMRQKLSWFQLAFLAIAPFLSYNGHEVFLFNVFERRVVIFGVTFWPQDVFLFVLATISLFVGIALFTAIAGRVFCGWACPQTVFLEMLFRKVEYLVEGNHTQQRKLAEANMSLMKFRKRLLKYVSFAVISCLISLVFTTYLIGRDGLWKLLQEGPAENASAYIAIGAVTALIFWHFSFFREQFCTFLCPYARLQSVLLDNNSLVVAYDEKRGEPRARGSRKKPLAEGEVPKGDCVDCDLCVQVCPTGIDIRNGFPQLECVNCTACIDACDNVMTSVKKPKGLIRYTSGNILEKGGKFKVTPRIAIYSIILLTLTSILGFLIFTRPDVDASILRKPGTLGRVTGVHTINTYNAKFINKTYNDFAIDLKVLKLNDADLGAIKAELSTAKAAIKLPKATVTEMVFNLTLPKDAIKGGRNSLEIGVYRGDELIDTVKIGFLNRHKI